MAKLLALTRSAQYGLQAMSVLASGKCGETATTQTLAHAADLPKNFLSSILILLCRAGLLRAHRGAIRGYSLLRPPAEISALEIVESIDGPLDTDVCILDTLAECNGKNPCPLHNVMLSIRETTKHMLLEHSLADLAKDWSRWRKILSSANESQE